MAQPEITLADGLVLRPGRNDDVEQVVALAYEAYGEDAEEPGIRWAFGAGGASPEDWTVVADGDRVVSISMLFDHSLRYGTETVPIGQVEYVATAEPYRRRGLIRAQFDVLHRRSADRGHLLQLISGIPHFYRRVGYGYAIDWPERLHLGAWAPTVPLGWAVEPAVAADVADLDRLHRQAQRVADVALERPVDHWPWIVATGASWNEHLFVARHDGDVHGYVRIQRRPNNELAPCDVLEAAADSIDAARALLAHAKTFAGDQALGVHDRPGTPISAALRPAGTPGMRYHPWYGRVPDSVALLDRLRPVLSERLARSSFATDAGELTLSFYATGVALTYEQGEVTAVKAVPGLEDPLEEGGRAGVAPDAIPALVLGRFGATGLEERWDDVHFGRDRPLAEVLFPKLAVDLYSTT